MTSRHRRMGGKDGGPLHLFTGFFESHALPDQIPDPFQEGKGGMTFVQMQDGVRDSEGL